MLKRIGQLFRSTRRSLRRIDYYSASRDARRWPPGTAGALVAAAILAIPLTGYLGTNFQRVVDSEVERGLLYQDKQGDIDANFTEGGGTGNTLLNPGSTQLGTFSFKHEVGGRGWPARTMTIDRPWQLNLDLFSEAAPRTDTRLDPLDPIAVALVDLLRETGKGSIMLSVDEARIREEHHLLAWCTNFLVTWGVFLIICLPIATLIVRLSIVLHNRRVRRRKQNRSSNKCLECGYDLRGLEFNERCPECGALAE